MVLLVSVFHLLVGGALPTSEPCSGAILRDLAVSEEPLRASDGGHDDRTRALAYAARGQSEAVFGHFAEAEQCLALAATLLPHSAQIFRDLAGVLGAQGKTKKALAAVRIAVRLGDESAEIRELRAALLLENGERKAARVAAREASSWQGTLIGAALSDWDAIQDSTLWIDEFSQRGAMSSLLLASQAANEGELVLSEALVAFGEAQALSVDMIPFVNAARTLKHRIERARRDFLASFRLRSRVSHLSNPDLLAGSDPAGEDGFRLAVEAEGRAQMAVGRSTIYASLAANQHFFLSDRARFSRLDLNVLSAAGAIDFPLGNPPLGVSLFLAARIHGIFARLFRNHHATTFEGGPGLSFGLGRRWVLNVQVTGTAVEYVDIGLPDGIISSLSRDSVGQRMLLSLFFETTGLDGHVELAFLRDDARGDAFDAVGGSLGGRGRVTLSSMFSLESGFAVTVRNYGPVGERSIAGPSLTRLEVRTAAFMAVRARFGPFDVIIEDTWFRSNARVDHAYTQNIFSTGLERTW